MAKELAKALMVRLLDDRILVRPEKVESEDKLEDIGGGKQLIRQLAAHKDAPAQGEVLEVGPGRTTPEGQRVPMQVESGDVVMYGKFAGQVIVIDGEELLMLREADITAVLAG